MKKSCDETLTNSSDISLSSLSLPNSSISSSSSSPQNKFYVPSSVDKSFKSKLNFDSTQIVNTDELESSGILNTEPDQQGDMPDKIETCHNRNKDLSSQQTSSSLNSEINSISEENSPSLKKSFHFSVKNKASDLKTSSMSFKPLEQIKLCKSIKQFPSSHIGNPAPMGARFNFQNDTKVLKKLKISRPSNLTSSDLNSAPSSSGELSVPSSSKGLLKPTSSGKLITKSHPKYLNTAG